MRLEIVAIFDQALGAFTRPAFVPSLGVAVRGFQDEVNRADGEMMRHPNDYSLHHLGVYDDTTGQFELLDVPLRLATAKSVLIVKE